MVKVVRGFGLDLALRHGALVYGKWRIGRRLGDKLIKHKVVLEWGKKTEAGDIGIPQDASDLEIRKFCNEILKVLKSDKIPRVPIGIDWDPLSAYWGNKRQAVTLAFLAGYMARTLELLGFPVIFITPKEVRTRLELGARTKKALVWALFPDIKRQKTSSEDMKDSLILSYLVARGFSGVKNSKQISIHQRQVKGKNTKRSSKAA